MNSKAFRDLVVIVSLLAVFFVVAHVSAGGLIGFGFSNESGLVGHWTFDGNTIDWSAGTVTDASGRGNTGTITGLTNRSVLLGKMNQALRFNNNSINVGNDSSLKPSAAFTLSAWYRPESFTDAWGGAGFIMADGQDCCGNTGGVGIHLTTGQKPRGFFWDTSGQKVVLGNNSRIGEWNHVVLVFDGTSLTIYQDGVYANSSTFAQTSVNVNASDFYISNQFATNFYRFHGDIDDVRVYNRALSTDEVNHLYKLGATIASGFEDTTDLVGHWTFDTGKVDFTNNLAVDETGKNNGTLVSMSSASQVQGKLEKGLGFDGSADYVNLGNVNAGSAFTFSLWIKRDSTSSEGYQALITKGRELGDQFYGVWMYQSKLIVSYYAGDLVYGGTPLEKNRWYYVVGTYDGSRLRVYLDGVDDEASCFDDCIATPVENTSNMLIGAAGGVNEYFNGVIDDVRVYSNALALSEVLETYESLAPTYISTTITGVEDGLVGHWTFDGPDTDWGTNTTNDVSGEGNTGTMTNMSTSSSPTFGRLGQALTFDGVDGYVDVGTPSSLSGATVASISAWVYRPAPTSIVSVGSDPANSTAYRFGFLWFSNSKLYCLAENGTGSYPSISKADIGWHHIVLSYDGSRTGDDRCRIYLDTELQSLDSGGGTPAASLPSGGNQKPFKIGSLYASGQTYSDGTLDDVRIYNRALTTDEILQLYNLGK
ncbi:MAG: LamG domain-containing protein [bacterium]|nr:LamG domain-containing protein [bacterium]